jgi:transposase-like protein
MKDAPDPRYRHRFPAEIISHAIWLYHTFCLSFRDVELMLAERGIEATPYPYRTFTGWIAPASPGARKQTLSTVDAELNLCRRLRAIAPVKSVSRPN